MKFPKLNWTFRKSFAVFMAVMIFILIAASPSFQSFNVDQFNTVGNIVAIPPLAQMTNIHFKGNDVTFPISQRFDTTVTTNVMGVSDASGANIYQMNNISGDYLLTGPVGIIMTVTQALAQVWFKLPIFGNGYGISNLVTVASNTTVITTNGRTLRFWGARNITNNNGVEDVVYTPAITNDATIANGYVKTTSTPTADGDGHSGYALQSWFDVTDNLRTAKIAEDQISNAGFSSGLYLYGKALTNHGTIWGLHAVDLNLAADNRLWVHRVHDPGGSSGTDLGGYSHEMTRFAPTAPDKSSAVAGGRVFAYNLLNDEFGNIGIGLLPSDVDAADDSLGAGHVYTHPWAKLALYSSPNYPILGLLPQFPLLSPPITNSFEYDGTNIYFVDKQLNRYRFVMMDTNNQLLAYNGSLLTGISGGKFDPLQFGTNGSSQVELATGASVTNLTVQTTANLPTLVLAGANTSANMDPKEATLHLTNSSGSGQIEMVATVNGKSMGGWSFDQVGSFNIFGTNGVIWGGSNSSAGAILTWKNFKIGIGTAAAAEPKEKFVVSGNQNITNGYLRLSVIAASPTASNFQAQVYCKTNATTGANELFSMNSSGVESQISGNYWPSNTAKISFPSTNFIPSTGFSGTRYTNLFGQRGVLLVSFSFVDAAAGTPVARVQVEQNGSGGVKTNTFFSSMVGGLASTVTNTVNFGIVNPNAVVIVTDISGGTGASVGVVNSELELE